MKKLLLLASLLMLLTSACTSMQDTTRILNVEDINKEDLQYMDDVYKNYRWYECGILLANYIDIGGGSDVAEITNVFQVLSDGNTSHDVNIVMIRHTLEKDEVLVIPSLIVEEDVPIIKEKVTITFKESYLKVLTQNPKPHTKRVILRKQLGPNDTNPQYIYGNNQGLIFVDASTGVLVHDSPAFERTGFITWLGEWPYSF